MPKMKKITTYHIIHHAMTKFYPDDAPVPEKAQRATTQSRPQHIHRNT